MYIAPSGPATIWPGTAYCARSGISVTRSPACAVPVNTASAARAATPVLVAWFITPGWAPPGRRASGESLGVIQVAGARCRTPAVPEGSNYGIVVERVNVSVLLYVPVLRASFAPIDWRKASVTESLLIGPL